MTPKQFEDLRGTGWTKTEKMLDAIDARRRHDKVGPVDADRLPELYRQACADLAIAEHRMYGMRLCHRLNRLVRRGYNQLYRRRALRTEVFSRYLGTTFPCAIRRNAGLFWLCLACFTIPVVAMMIGARHDPIWVQSILGPEGMAQFEEMYGRDADGSAMRPDGASDVAMFAFYIWNNIGIDFKTFSSGMLGGVGTLFILVFNGVFMGAAAGWVDLYGSPDAFYSFVIGHSGPELIGMIVAGMAGMKLGLAMLKPGLLPRGAALRAAAGEGMELLYGAAGLTLLAAFIEGFWSAQALPSSLKYGVGTVIWVLLITYLTFSGRSRAA